MSGENLYLIKIRVQPQIWLFSLGLEELFLMLLSFAVSGAGAVVLDCILIFCLAEAQDLDVPSLLTPCKSGLPAMAKCNLSWQAADNGVTQCGNHQPRLFFIHSWYLTLSYIHWPDVGGNTGSPHLPYRLMLTATLLSLQHGNGRAALRQVRCWQRLMSASP